MVDSDTGVAPDWTYAMAVSETLSLCCTFLIRLHDVLLVRVVDGDGENTGEKHGLLGPCTYQLQYHNLILWQSGIGHFLAFASLMTGRSSHPPSFPTNTPTH